MIKKLTAVLLVMFLLIAAFPVASFAEGEETAGPSVEPTTEAPASEEPQPTEAPAVTEMPAVTETPAPTETPAATETPAVTEAPASAEIPVVTAAGTKGDAPESDALKETISGPDAKLSTKILQLVDEKFLPKGITKNELLSQMKEQRQIKEGTVTNGTDSKPSELLYVYIQLKQGSDFSVLSPYVAEIVNKDEAYGGAAAYVSVKNIEAIASLDAVLSIREVTPPRVNVGSVTSQGDSLLNADKMRAATGVNGTGVKIGIISDGVDDISEAIASGDVPANVTVLSNTRSGVEGTAMLEIVYDLAPGASLYFHDCGSNMYGFWDAIAELADAGCNVICDDIAWITDWFFADDYVAQHLKDLLAARDITYVSSAGNSAYEHYQGVYYDDGSKWMDFSRGTDPSNTGIYGFLPKDGSIQIVLQWDDPIGGSTNDYDLCLFDSSYLYAPIDKSTSVQNGSSYPYPIEVIDYTNNTGADLNIEIAVKNWSAEQNKTLEMYAYIDGYSETADEYAYIDNINIVPEDSIFGHPAVPGVICAGSVDATDPNNIDYYSCRGPVTMLTETRLKPDICGIDGVYVSGAGGFGKDDKSGHHVFYGTSAAAPHVAALAALIKSEFPLMPARQVKQIMMNSAVDLGTSGYDCVYGYGRPDAQVAGAPLWCVQFDSQGGTGVPPVYTYKNSTIEIPTGLTKTGYLWMGWYKEAACINQWIFADSVTENMTLYAKWSPMRYGITCIVDGGSWFDYPPSYTIESPPLTLGTPTRFGCIFAGWVGTDLPAAQMNVTIPAGSIGDKIYTATWIPQQQSNLLGSVNLSCGSLNRPFSPAVTSYKINIGENDPSFTLTAVRQYDGAAMTMNKAGVTSYTVSVANGKSAKITVKVALGRKAKTYTFTVTRAKSSNNALASLASTAGAWSQGFDPNVLNYTLYLDENTKSTAIRASAAAGKAAKLSPASSKVSLNNGQSKTVRITVRAQSGAKRTYTITVVRAASANANLKLLKAPGLSPGFNPAQTNYSVTLPANKGVLAIAAKAAGYKAAVSIDGGKASKKVALANGQSVTVRVVVTSQAGNRKEYVITVTRQ